MVKSVRIKFDKILHDTGKAILIRIDGVENWIPKKLCRNLIINKKLGGNVCIPYFFAEKLDLKNFETDIEIIHHIPKIKQKLKTNHDKELFR